MPGVDGGMSFIFSVFPVFFVVIFTLVIGVFITVAVRGIKQWSYNNKQPIYSDHVIVVDKRTHLWRSGHHHGSSMHHHGGSTSYFITFEFEDGERREFMVPSQLYGLTVAGDTGTLTWQGTRFHGFQRPING